MRKGLLLIALLVFCQTLFGQAPDVPGGGKITGKVVDSATGAPIEYATISLTTPDGNKVINGATADDKGVFKITDVPAGTYRLAVVFFGYRTTTVNNVVVKNNSTLALGNIKLTSTAINLGKATIVADKAIIENKIDKMVYNVENDVTSQTGVASDVLKKVPQVSVDVDGNVELQGNSSILFLINGKPSVVYGSNITEVLQSIPASQIQSIEVITSPGAKYDAAGTGGIINIILKKSTAEGINGNVSLSGGTRLENGSFNLNAHHKHFSANAYLSGNGSLQSTALNSLNSTAKDSVSRQTTILTQNGSSEFIRGGFQTGAGFDWDLSEHNNISGSFGYNYYGNNYTSNTNRNTRIQDSAGNTLSSINDQLPTSNTFYSKTLNWSLNYKHKFKKEGQELTLSYLSSIDNNYVHYEQSQQNVATDSVYAGSYGDNPGTQKETEISLDYTHPINDDAEIEAGGKTIITQINSNSNVYLLNPANSDYAYSSTQSLILGYTSNIYSGYASAKFKLFHWLDLKTGFRYEYTQPSAYYSNVGGVNINPYGTAFPSITLSHNISHGQSIKISYSRRIERPDYGDLNPFVNATNPRYLSTGNPNLLPEIGDKAELSYNLSLGKGDNISITLFYRGQSHDIQPLTTFYPSYKVGDTVYTDVSVSMPWNVGREDNYGTNLYASIPIADKFNFRTNMAFFQRYITNGPLPGDKIQGFNYRLNGNLSYEISKTFVVEFFGNYNSRRINVQGSMPGFFSYNFALRKQFADKKASIALTATNPFNYYVNQATTLTGDNFTSYSLRQLPYQSFGINFTYKFGHLEFKPEKDNEPQDPNGGQQGN